MTQTRGDGRNATGALEDRVQPEDGLWRHPDFMWMWTGQTISLLGSQVTLLVLPLTAILVFKASAFQVGSLSTVEFLPFVLLGLPVGVWVRALGESSTT